MADVARRTYARHDHGPRNVESRRSSTRNDHASPNQTRNQRTDSSSPYTLTITSAPPTTITSTTPFNTRIIISSSRRRQSSQGLLAVVSLVAETTSGPRPLPAGYLVATSSNAKLMDSVSEPSRTDLAAVNREIRADAVGAAGFEGLCVREAGSYRVRVTLARMEGDVYEAVAEADSPAFRVTAARGAVNGAKY